MTNLNAEPGQSQVETEPSLPSSGLRQLGESALAAVADIGSKIRGSFGEIRRGVREIVAISAVVLPVAAGALVEITRDEARAMRADVATRRRNGEIDAETADAAYNEIDKMGIDDDPPIADLTRFNRDRAPDGTWQQGS